MSSSATPAQACENCVRPGDKASGEPEGKITQYAGVEAYVTGSSKDHAIIYSPDVFGHSFFNHQRNADAYAAAGFTVIIPCMLNDAMDAKDPNCFAAFGEWLGRNPPAHASSVCATVATQMNKDFKSVIGVGLCYGARMIVDLVEAKQVKAAVCFHPTFLKAEDAAAIKASGVPVLFNCAQTDSIFTPDVRAGFEKELQGTKSSFVEYPGTEHGFGVRPHGPEAQKSSSQAQAATCAWLKAQA